MQKKVAILQSNYIPWKGYFDLINMVDLFIFHDDLQYTKGDWRNRNLIKTPKGTQWLTIPCGTNEHRLIHEVELNDSSWQSNHWSLIKTNYQHAEYFKTHQSFFEELYLGIKWRSLSEMNQAVIKRIARELLGISTEFEDSRKYSLTQHKAERVKELLLKCGADEYISGPAAQKYLSAEFLAEAGVQLTWMNYDGYPEYPQLYPPFTHQVSIVDLLFNTGKQAMNFMKSFIKAGS
jgi:hypothetical protein